jgi:hypothetical protein
VTPAGAAGRTAPFYTLPQQPPGTGNLVFWIDHKTNANFAFYDAVWYRTFAMLEDMTGNGNGFNQANKVQQPRVSSLGGALFTRGTFLPCESGDMLAGAGQVTLGFTFTVRRAILEPRRASFLTCPIRTSPPSISSRSPSQAAPEPAHGSSR